MKNIVYLFTTGKNCIMCQQRYEKLSLYPSLSFVLFGAFSDLYSHERIQRTDGYWVFMSKVST